MEMEGKKDVGGWPGIEFWISGGREQVVPQSRVSSAPSQMNDFSHPKLMNIACVYASHLTF